MTNKMEEERNVGQAPDIGEEPDLVEDSSGDSVKRDNVDINNGCGLSRNNADEYGDGEMSAISNEVTPMLPCKLKYDLGDMEVEITEIEPAMKDDSFSILNSAITVAVEPASSENLDEKEEPDRAMWGGQFEFLLTCVGYAVGLGNVWRFPFLCYKNGGGAFLIPYILMLGLVGLPLFYMELAIGQFASLGPISIWKLNPLLKGVGYASVIVNWLIALYYNVVVAQCIFYFFASMTSELPWSSCNNTWNTENCTWNNATRFAAVAKNLTITTPTEEYYRNYVLQQSDSIQDFGTVNWKLALCLLLAWVTVWLVLLKGIQSLGKVVYFTALFPYLMLTILLIRGVTLDGAGDGILYYLSPDFERLKDPRVWSDAATQIFYSLSACTGGMIAMSSYNKFSHNCYRDSIIVGIVNCGTSIFAGLVIFSILGFIAHEKATTVDKVATDGPGLAFEVYPEALARMPWAPMWSVFFFLMMLTLGFGSEFSMVECLLSAFADEFPVYLTKTRLRSFIYRSLVIISCFLLGLPMVCNGGMWLLNLVDYSVSGFPLLFVGLLETIAINWIYGFGKFSEDIEMMLGSKPGIYWKITWKFITPFIISLTILLNMAFYKPADLNGELYPHFANVLSWLIALFPMMAMVCWFLYEYCYQGGGYKLIQMKMTATTDWGPANSDDRARHQRYGSVIPGGAWCDPHLLAKLMGSNISNISEFDLERHVSNLTPAVSHALLQSLQNINSANGTPQNLTPAQSLLAIAKSNSSFNTQLQRKQRNSPSECSEV